jgi:Druantia protein DruA
MDGAALADIGALLQRQPPLSRRQLSLHLCGLWNWRTDTGQLKDMAARTLLRKLEQRGLIELPPVLNLPPAARAGARPCSVASPLAREFSAPVPIRTSLKDLSPVTVSVVEAKSDRRLFGRLLQEHHYLGWNRPVGESIAYWAHDRSGRLLALCLWGAAAWKVAPRD